ncbi:MAG: signal peptidase I [Candidatus Delongbacteria bacterium]|nr:signal peptidase I [Candidatus Delongbacteria bacterium]MBN2836785.1 signal peptidase I [Candidatus Delongbacteria bacterium]
MNRVKLKPLIFLIILATVLFLKAVALDFYKINSDSMSNTLQHGDYILVNRMAYRFRTPNRIVLPFIDYKFRIPSFSTITDSVKRGDVILFYLDDNPNSVIKRCVAVENDTVEIYNKYLIVNGKPVELMNDSEFIPFYFDSKTFDPDYSDNDIVPTGNGNRDYYNSIIVPKNSCFVLGDNRDYSYDSRYFGFVSYNSIQGKAILVYYSEQDTLRSERILNFIK